MPNPVQPPPGIGEPNSTADPKIRSALVELQSILTAEVDDANIAAGGVKPTNLYVPRSKVKRVATGQAIANVTNTVITFPTLDYDVGGYGAPGATKLTVPVGGDGVYAVIGGLVWAANSAGTRYAALVKNLAGGGASAISESECGPNGTASVRHSLCGDVVLAAGDFIELHAVQGSGGSLNVTDALLSLRRVA